MVSTGKHEKHPYTRVSNSDHILFFTKNGGLKYKIKSAGGQHKYKTHLVRPLGYNIRLTTSELNMVAVKDREDFIAEKKSEVRKERRKKVWKPWLQGGRREPITTFGSVDEVFLGIAEKTPGKQGLRKKDLTISWDGKIVSKKRKEHLNQIAAPNKSYFKATQFRKNDPEFNAMQLAKGGNKWKKTQESILLNRRSGFGLYTRPPASSTVFAAPAPKTRVSPVASRTRSKASSSSKK